VCARRAGTQVEITKAAVGQDINNFGEKDGDAVKFTMRSAIANIKRVADIAVQYEQEYAGDRCAVQLR
jgi:ribosomal protein L37AE/L43A